MLLSLCVLKLTDGERVFKVMLLKALKYLCKETRREAACLVNPHKMFSTGFTRRISLQEDAVPPHIKCR